jgi:hypothetical protein
MLLQTDMEDIRKESNLMISTQILLYLVCLILEVTSVCDDIQVFWLWEDAHFLLV